MSKTTERAAQFARSTQEHVEATKTGASGKPVGHADSPAGGDIGPREARELLDAGRAVLIDVREPDEHARERIPGAVHVPLGAIRGGDASLPERGQATLIVHCRSGRRSAEALAILERAGHAPVLNLAGGIEAWRRAGLDVDRTRGVPISIMRQVQITAGSLGLIGTVLGAAVSPWFLVVPGFIGAGLTFAGVTGTCGLASVLSVMPWNRALARGASGGPRDAARQCCSS